MEVIVKRVQWIWFQFAENAPEFLLNPIDRVKEISSIDVQLARAKLPVRTKQEVIPEQFIFEIGESSLSD